MKVRRLLKGFRHGQKGFTLIELVVVIAILGILVAIAVPNLISFIGHGTSEAAATELDIAQTAVIAAMAANNVSTVSGAPATLDASNDVDVDGAGGGDVGVFLVNGVAGLHGSYSVAADGTVTQTAYP